MNISKKASIIALALIISSIAITTIANAQDPWDWDTDDQAAAEAAAGGFLCLSGALCILPIIMLIIWIIIAVWVYKDAEKRGSNGILWVIIILITGIIGLIIWLVIRPPIGGDPSKGQPPAANDRMCPSCGRPIPLDAQVCPYCGKDFRQK
jgi:hypothetical protein